MRYLIPLVFLLSVVSVCPSRGLAQKKDPNHIVVRYPWGSKNIVSDFTISQPAVPFSDSGQWVPTELHFTNNLNKADTIVMFFMPWQWLGRRDELMEDSARFIHWAYHRFASDSDRSAFVDTIVIPPHSKTPDLVVPCFFRSPYPGPDTTGPQFFVRVTAMNDYLLSTDYQPRFAGRGNCAQITKGFLSLLRDTAFVPERVYGSVLRFQSDKGFHLSETPVTATFEVVGEYHDSFTVQGPSRIVKDSALEFECAFRGAPQHLVHDTIVATYTNCVWTFVERKPIVGLTTYVNAHRITASPDTAVIPFLGETVQRMWVHNRTPKRMEAYGFSEVPSDRIVFTPLWPAGDVLSIAPFDSASITFRLLDHPNSDQFKFPSNTDVIDFKLRIPEAGDILRDTSPQFTLRCYTNVYSPDYYSLPPKLTQAARPAGIIFQNWYETHDPFTTAFKNYDNENYEFYPPYYDDPHFKISAPGLPRVVTPAIGDLILGKTTFTGDSAHNYRTQLHWPRVRSRDGFKDTITIDVLALGSLAPPYQLELGVRRNPTAVQAISSWPNPSNGLIQLQGIETPTSAIVSDVMGREVMRLELRPNESVDLRALPTGSYYITLPSLNSVARVTIDHRMKD